MTRGVPRDPHLATHRTFTRDTNPQAHWRFGWTRSQCIAVAQLRTGHSPLLASYLHRIGRQSPACPHCGGDDESAQHLLLCCPSHASARTSTNYINSTDPRRVWSFLESIGAVTCPPTGNERERQGCPLPSQRYEIEQNQTTQVLMTLGQETRQA